jgi:multidrug efflux pump subunit AcrA (membrane-fusion protein)
MQPVLFIALLCISACSRHGADAPKGGSDLKPSQMRLKRTVELHQVSNQRILAVEESIGSIEAERQTELPAGVEGVLEDMLVREGQHVDPQTVVARIDQELYKSALDTAVAAERRSEAAMRKAAAAEGKAIAAQKRADSKLALAERMVFIGDRAASSVEEREQRRSDVVVAQADLNSSAAEVVAVRAESHAMVADVEAARAARVRAELNWRKSQVRPRFAGQVNQRKRNVGEYVKADSVILTISDLTRLRVTGHVPEKSARFLREARDRAELADRTCLAGAWLASTWAGLGASVATDEISRVRDFAEGASAATLFLAGHNAGIAALVSRQAGALGSGYQVRFTLPGFEGPKFHGRVFFISDVANPDTRMFECKAELPPQPFLDKVRPGMTARLMFPLPGADVTVVIPEEAVRATERGFVVFRPIPVKMPDGSVEWVAQEVADLQLGRRQPGFVEVVRGLTAGEMIIRKGAESLENRTPIEMPAEMAARALAGRMP